jgi:D-aspartate ligase
VGAGPRPAILLGGAETAVPVCRSLGRGGIPVVAYGDPEDPVRHSRFCTRYVETKAAGSIQEGWLDQLLSDPTPGALMPVSDQGVELVARNREALVARGFTTLEGDDEATLAMLDKSRTYEIAERAGIPTPAFAILHGADDIEPALERLPLPCGIKPLEGHIFRERTGLNDKVIVIESAEEFRRLAGAWLGEGLGLMATEIVAGPDERLVALFAFVDGDSRPLVTFTNRKLRQDPPHFGVGCYVIEEDVPEVAELGHRFLAAAGYGGMAHVEFKQDPGDGRFKLIECNPRFYLSTELVIASGLDVPLYAYRRLCGEDPEPPVQTRKGLRLIHPLPDFRTMREMREAGELTFSEWLRSLMHRQRFTLFAADDPRPSLVINFRTARRLVGKGARRALGRAKG